MRRSDIFDEFAKIAQAQGLLSKATPEEIQKKLEENPRMDSLDISAIEALYGVKPDTPKDMQYKRNIIENAHPDTVVVSPSYDKLNGLVENLNQRQDIIMHIVQRTPDGHITNRKYAEKQLLLALVRLGNDLDNQNKTELRALADVCLEQTATITKKADKLTKNAAIVGLAPIVIGVVLAVGALYIQQHMNFRDDGFLKNHEKLIKEIDDMLTDNATVYGYEYSAEFKTVLNELKNKVLYLKQQYDLIGSVIKDIEKPRTGKELVALVKSPQTKTVFDAYTSFKEAVDDIIPYLNTIESNFKNPSYQKKQIVDSGVATKIVDYSRFLHGGNGLVANDYEDVVRSLPPYIASMDEILKVLSDAQSAQENAKRRLDVINSRAPIEFKPATTPMPAAQAPASNSSDISDDKANELEKDLAGMGIPIGT